jgi:hypothetical protein
MKKSPEPSPLDPGLVLHDQPGAVPELELPVAPDFVSRRTPMSLAQMLPILEERRKMFPVNRDAIHARRRQPVPVEFVL